MEGEDRDAVGGSARPVESRQVIDLQRVAVEVDVFGAERLSVRHDECEVGGHCVVRLLAGVDEPAVRGRRGDPVASVAVGDRKSVEKGKIGAGRVGSRGGRIIKKKKKKDKRTKD